jgi:small subunit ribosomal protein S26
MRELNATPADEEAEFQRCLLINDSWNKDIAKMRTLRVEEDNEKRREEIMMNIEKKKERQESLKKSVEEQIKGEQRAAEGFITRENIDQAIERALANPTSYNYCIDMDGTKKGDSIKEEPKSPEQQSQQ